MLVALNSVPPAQEQLKFEGRSSLLEFLERDVAAVLAPPRPGEEPALDVKATRAAWTKQGR